MVGCIKELPIIEFSGISGATGKDVPMFPCKPGKSNQPLKSKKVLLVRACFLIWFKVTKSLKLCFSRIQDSNLSRVRIARCRTPESRTRGKQLVITNERENAHKQMHQIVNSLITCMRTVKIYRARFFYIRLVVFFWFCS